MTYLSKVDISQEWKRQCTHYQQGLLPVSRRVGGHSMEEIKIMPEWGGWGQCKSSSWSRPTFYVKVLAFSWASLDTILLTWSHNSWPWAKLGVESELLVSYGKIESLSHGKGGLQGHSGFPESPEHLLLDSRPSNVVPWCLFGLLHLHCPWCSKCLHCPSALLWPEETFWRILQSFGNLNPTSFPWMWLIMTSFLPLYIFKNIIYDLKNNIIMIMPRVRFD